MTLPYTLEYYGTGTTPIDISQFVITIDKFTDVGTGEIASARLMLDARFGDFITQANSDTTPIIKQYDLFRLEMRDSGYSRFLIQDDIAPQKNSQGSFITLELLGRESYLQKMYFPGHFIFISFRDLVRKIRDFYNTNRGSLQPMIRNSATDLALFPEHTYGTFDFGEKTTVYDALMDIVKRLKVPRAGGGADRFFGLLFSDSTSGSAMLMRITPQGITPTNPKVLENPNSVSEVKQPLKGNIVVVKGQPGTGSFPKEIALWRSLVEEFENLPIWKPTIKYEKDIYTRYQNAVYQAKNNHANANILPTVTASWTQVEFADYVEAFTGDRNFQYSPWTKDKQAIWRNRGGNAGSHPADGTPESSRGSFLVNNPPAGQTDPFNALCFPDSNIVIRDPDAWRDEVDFRVASLADIPEPYLYDATPTATTVQDRTYHGMRVLVDPAKGTIAKPFTGNDDFGNPFRNSIVAQTQTGNWIVIKTAEQFDEVVVRSEGRTYDYNLPLGRTGVNNSRSDRSRQESTTNLAWRDITEVHLGNDCFHYPTIMENTTGLIGENTSSVVRLNNSATTKFNDNSAIKLEYEFGENDIVGDIADRIIGTTPLGSLIRLLTDDGNRLDFTAEEETKQYRIDWYNIGWWAVLWESPDPKSTYHGISESVGDLFGGDADNKRPLLDLNNLNQTPSGKMGYGHDDSDLLDPIDGIKLLFNFDIRGFDAAVLSGNIPFRMTIYDTLGNVWTSDIAHRFIGSTQELDFPLSSFGIYRARIQPAHTLSNVISRIINPELKITEIFERQYVKRITLQCMLAYDDDGRYDPITWEGFLRKLTTIVTGTTIKYTGIVDAFHFTKTPVAIAKDEIHPTNSSNHRHLMAPIKQYEKISNVAQLQKLANAELDIAKHQNDFFTLTFDDFSGVEAEDSVFVKDSDFISEAEKTGEANTKKMIVKKITYSVGEKGSTSGVIAHVDLYRGINP